MGECNLVNVGAVVGKMISGSATIGNPGVFTHNVSSGNETWLLKSLILANNSPNGTDIQAYAYFGSGGHIFYNTWIPRGTTLVIIDESTPIYLQYNEQIVMGLNSGDGLDYTFKYETLRE